MQHKYCVEVVDRSLQDVLENGRPFGGITVVLGGDFRQILPVVPKGVREDIVSASLRRSYIWGHVQVLSLSQNMRLIDNSSENVAFPHTLLEIGSNPKETVELPAAFNKCANLDELICSVYPHLEEVTTASTTYLTERMILSARNEDVNIINIQAMAKIQGQEIVYLAADKLSEADADDRTTTDDLPFSMTRRQFPLRLALSMTINKSQGQSVKFVGIDLTTSVFSHDQLYLAFSGCTSPKRITVLLPPDTANTTMNAVYPDVLL
ncbi:hypothetical protein GIB67_007200 [Kingdonia uniflora]|uniref:ATP-dependent DNA helicase n=1 Tax=Kingdonia uniflora TaxID=39325 RepID=A0A7J7L533_9MAGN|nr:hypothetical protein GIB67_007199 [Kingdonia uniflora]KAF6137727.1 hypothetical protein GIB67_007200 [Kingdonia uniflora]